MGVMARDKLSDRTEAVRLADDESRWIDGWVADTGNKRSAPIRAAVRLLRLVVSGMDYEPRVRLVTKLSRNESSSADEAEVWAALAVRTMVASGRGKGGAAPPGRK
jgi:hypothetical protein